MLVLPTHSFGYTGHVMDFPGTINTHFEHFIDQVLDITKSLAYHGFKKIVLLNGHGSNWPNLDLVARRTNLETDAECIPVCWWSLLQSTRNSCPAGGRASSRAAARTPASWRRRFIFTLTATTFARTRSRAGRSASMRRRARSMGRPLRRRPGDDHLLDQQLFRDRRPGRCRAGHGRERPPGVRRGRHAACPVRELVQGPSQDRAATSIAGRRRCRFRGGRDMRALVSLERSPTSLEVSRLY